MSDDRQRELERWQQLALKELGELPPPLQTPSSVSYAAVYQDTASPDLASSSADPGELPGLFPFTRGPYASMYRGRPWTLRQYAGFSTAEETNAFYLQALASGQRGLSVAFDLPTHRGYDSDQERVAGDVGRAGVAIDSVEDMTRLFQGIRLNDVSVSMTMNGAVLPVMAAYIVAAEEQGAERAQLRGTIQNDILKELMVRNTYIYPPAPSMRIVTDVVAYTAASMPKFNPLSVSGYHFQEAGAPADLELAYTLADGLEYVRHAAARGLAIDDFAPRISFFFGIGMQFFLEIAKLRAARRLWAHSLEAAYGPLNPASTRLRMHCQTSGVSLAAQGAHNNVVRTTVEALAAVLGGTQSLHTNAYDEALALPSDHAATVARNTQLILSEETDLCFTADPLGGSYLVESLTDQLCERCGQLLREIEEVGGMTQAIAQGLPQLRIAKAAAERQVRIDRNEEAIIGVNRYPDQAEPQVELRSIDNQAVREAQRSRLAQLRRDRDATAVGQALQRLRNGAEADGNLLELTVDCIRARATLGEVSEQLAQVFGRHEGRPVAVGGVFTSGYNDDAAWKRMKTRIESFEKTHGRRPRLMVAKLGQDGHDRGAKVIASGFADLGFDVDVGPLFQTPQEVARAAIDNDVHVIGISTQAGAHTSLLPQLMAELQAQGSEIKVVCGGIVPAADRPALERLGVSAVFGPGAKVIDCASQVLDLLLETSE